MSGIPRVHLFLGEDSPRTLCGHMVTDRTSFTGDPKSSSIDCPGCRKVLKGMTSEEDISEAWHDLIPSKAVEPMAQIDPTAPGISELTDDFLEAQGAPKEFFYVSRGYGLEYMGIQKYRCVGLSVKPGPATGSRRSPAYVGLPLEVIWAGPKFKVNLSKKYRWSKGQVALTVEDAYKMFDKYRAEHITERRSDIKRMEQQIAGCQKNIQDMEASIQALENTPYPLTESGPIA